MAQPVSTYWWAFCLRGLVALILGLPAFFSPVVTFRALVIGFGLFTLIQGILLIGTSLAWLPELHGWVFMLDGAINLMAWLLTFKWPDIGTTVLANYIAAWALAAGIIEIAGAILLPGEVKGERVLLLSGAVSVLFALALLVNPYGTRGVVYSAGMYAIIFGSLMIALGLKIYNMVRV